MKLKVFLTALLLAVAQLALSQNDFIRVSVGYSRTNVLIGDLDFLSPDKSYKGGFLALVTYNHPFSNNFYLGAGAGCYNKGFKSRIRIFDEFANFVTEEDLNWDFNYIGMPIYAGFRKGHSSMFFAELGIVPSFLTKSVADFIDITGGAGQIDARVNMTDAVDNFDLSIFSQIGLRKELSDSYSIDFSVGVQQSLTGIGFVDVSTGEDRFHTAFNFSVGLVYQLE